MVSESLTSLFIITITFFLFDFLDRFNLLLYTYWNQAESRFVVSEYVVNI